MLANSQWDPVQKLDLLGMTWDGELGSLHISDKRIVDLLDSLDRMITKLPRVSARKLASITGKIMSLAPVVGQVFQLKTRLLHQESISRTIWNKVYSIQSNCRLVEELFFC